MNILIQKMTFFELAKILIFFFLTNILFIKLKKILPLPFEK